MRAREEEAEDAPDRRRCGGEVERRLEVDRIGDRTERNGGDPAGLSDDDIRRIAAERARRFLEEAPTTAAEAARIILDGVKAGRWRILVGKDAHLIDAMVRRAPEDAYEPEFFQQLANETGWRLGR